MPAKSRLLLVALGVVLAGAFPAQARAQDEAPPRNVSVSLGLLQYDLASSGFAPMLSLRAATPINPVLVLEASLVAARPEQLGAATTLLIPEAQFQLALPFTVIRPYMGLGAGIRADLGGFGGSNADLTVSGSLGVRSWIRDRVGVVAEYRGRGVGTDFDQTTSEYTLGISWQP